MSIVIGKLIVGKYYKTRNGKKIYCALDKRTICPQMVSDNPFLCINMAGYTAAYTPSGVWSLNHPASPEDIISEWKEPHPFEGCPRGALVWMWDSPSDEGRIPRRFQRVHDNGSVLDMGNSTWTYGKRVLPSEI